MKSNYDKSPVVQVTQRDGDCAAGWHAIADAVKAVVSGRERSVLVIECYPGVDLAEIERELVSRLQPDIVVRAADALKDAAELEAQFADTLGDDPVFAKMRPWTIADFLSAERIEKLRAQVRTCAKGLMVVLGTGAAQIAQAWDVLVYADLARWEIQRRQRAHQIGNLGANNADASARELYKRAFFIDWRAADRVRIEIFEQIDFFLDTNIPDDPRMIAGELYRAGLKETCARPFRVVPFFDPGPWGGEWMRRHFDLPKGPPNFAWCFDCVPEENSLRLGFGSRCGGVAGADAGASTSRGVAGR